MIQGTTAAWEGCIAAPWGRLCSGAPLPEYPSFVSLSCNTATAMLKHCFSTPRLLSLPSGKSLTVHGCKHRHGFTPSTNRQLPFFHNALKCQVNQLLGGFFMRKQGSSFDYLPNATVESLNTVGRIQHADLVCELFRVLGGPSGLTLCGRFLLCGCHCETQ